MLQSVWITVRDITALKQAEAEVLRLNEELKSNLEQLTALQARLEQDNAYLLDEIRSEHNLGEMVGATPKFRELTERIHLVASTTATVLICRRNRNRQRTGGASDSRSHQRPLALGLRS